MKAPRFHLPPSRFCPWKGFSLIELLSVMAVISTLAAVTLPAMRGTLDGISVSGAAGLTQSEILLARQTAMSRNMPVEVRLYKHDDGTGDAWRVIGLVIPSAASGRAEDEWITAGKIIPGNVVIQDGTDFSTVLEKARPQSDQIAPWSAQESATAPRLLRGKSYVGFRFNPDGSTNLPIGQAWCLTLKNPNSRPVGTKPAANFVAIVLDSLTGRTVAYQP